MDSKTKLPANCSRPGPATTSKSGKPSSFPSDDVPKPPKKGSYAEVMAWGQATQMVLGQVGKIQHKQFEKLPSKQEREDTKAQSVGNIQKGRGISGCRSYVV